MGLSKTCTNCGHVTRYMQPQQFKTVNSCAQCTRKFDDELIDEIVKEHMKTRK